MNEIILSSIHRIEEDYDVKILYACESGSRAWGFPSKDSDYDVRFIYLHKKDYYLSIDPVGVGKKRDVIELPINDLLDVSGWDLTKALKLFRKSNPPLMEWLQSDIVYYQNFSTIDKLKAMKSEVFAPHSCLFHYLNMARNHFKHYLQGDLVKIKKYFYVLRPVLAGRWIERFDEFPPLDFNELLDKVLAPGDLKDEIKILLERKMAGDELDMAPKIDIIHNFLHQELNRLEIYAKSLNVDVIDPTESLNGLFREALDEVWAEERN